MLTNREKRLHQVIVPATSSINGVLKVLDSSGTGILLVCDSDRHILGVITDGDIRRAILDSVDFSKPCISIANSEFVYATEGISPEKALKMMDRSRRYAINHLPVVNKKNQVVDLILRRDLISDSTIPLRALVMAGGYGKRLSPLTEKTPKPMISIGDKPILEHIISKLRDSGLKKVHISTHYLKEKITGYFGNGETFDVDIEYINEEKPLGTAGCLRLVERLAEPLLVINGDIMTDVDFRAMFDFHREHNASMTVGVRQYEFQIPYGVVESEGPDIIGLCEKPVHKFFINTGIYIMQPFVPDVIPCGVHYNMTDLIDELLRREEKVVSFPITEYWVDIGHPADLKKAHADYQKNKTICK